MLGKVNQLCLSAILGALIATLSGLPGLAQAASTACDQTNFAKFFLAPDGVTTFGITSTAMTWPAANTLAKAQGARLAVVTGPAVNNAIFSNFSSRFTAPAVTSYPGKKAWIDLTDPNNIPDWSMPNQAPIIMPSRFSWADGTSTYTNWAAGQPDGYCTAAEMAANPNHICYGENYAAINRDGTWSDEGDHGATPVTLPAVVEWPNKALDCVKPATPVSTPVVMPLPGADQGKLWCTDPAKDTLKECLHTTDGQQLCPMDKTLCNVDQEQATCPAGWDGTPGTVNTSRTPSPMCQVDAHSSCPTTGAYLANPDLCYKDAYKSCPTGMNYSAANNRCERRPQCGPGETYDDITNKCGWTTSYGATPNYTYSCPNGGTLNGSVCSSDTSYPATPMYSCLSGGTLTGNSCTVSTTYGASVIYTCNPGDTLSGTTCIAGSSTPAALSYICPSGGTVSGQSCITPKPNTTGYSQSQQAVSSLTRYIGRYETSSGHTTSNGILDAIQAVLSVTPGGGMTLQSYCAWGGAGNNGCEYPNWNWRTDRHLEVTSSPSAAGISFYFSLWSQEHYCPAGTGTLVGKWLYDENSNPINYVEDCELLTNSYQCMQLPAVDGDGNPYTYCGCPNGGVLDGTTCKVISTTTPSLRDGAKVEDSGRLDVANTDVFGCPSGYTTASTPIASTAACQQIITTWGNATGIYDCNDYAKYNCTTTVQACPAGTTDTGSSCSSAATPLYTCQPGTTLVGSVCTASTNYASNPAYVCPSGGTVSGSSCSYNSTYSATYTFACPNGGTLAGANCVSGATYTAATFTNYTCPLGGALSGTTCYINNQVNPTCPGGSFQDNGSSGDVCFAPYNPVCNDPAFVVQVPGQPDLCQSPAQHDCPLGYAWNGSPVGKCEALPVCQHGVYLAQSNTCYMKQTCPLDQSVCNANSTPADCPAGSTLDSTSNMCSAAPAVTCPSGYSWDKATDKCTAAPTCQGGAVYNPTTGFCEKSIQTTCPAGFSIDSSKTVCTATPGCPGGGGLNLVTQRCELSITTSCLPGYTFDSAKNVCYAPHQCASGFVFSAASNQCVSSNTYAATANYSCPSGGTLSGTTCITSDSYGATPTYYCPSGGSLSGSTCLTSDSYAATPGYWCPSGGTLSGTTCYTSGNYAATPNYYCPSGGTLSGTTCTTGSSYGATPNYSCPSGGSLSGTTCNSSYSAAYHPPVYGDCQCYWADGYCDVSGQGLSCSVSDDCINYTTVTACGAVPAYYSCDSGGSLSGATCYISYGASFSGYSCPSGGSLSGSTCDTTSTYGASFSGYSCPSGGSLSGSTCYTSGSYGASFSGYSCPSGGSLSGSTCYTSGSYGASVSSYYCPSGGSLSGSTCITSSSYGASVSSYSCSAGDVLSGSTCTHTVQITPTCPTGSTLTAGRCEQALTATCPTPYSYDTSRSTCYSLPACSPGAFLHGRCEIAVTKDCGTGTLDSTGTLCSQVVTCPADPAFALNSSIAFSKPLNKCLSTAQHACVAGTAYSSLPAAQCQTYPACRNGSTYNAQTGSCCPGTALSCHQVVGDTTLVAPGVPAQYCSPDKCQNDTSNMDTITDTPTGQNDKTNDGGHDDKGNCLGQIYLFNGNDMRCRHYDNVGMTTSIAELVAQIALMATGVGEAMFASELCFETTVAMEGAFESMGMSAQMATSVAQGVMQSAISTTLTTAANTTISATINGNLNGVGAGLTQGAMSFGISVAGSLVSGMASGALSGIKDYLGLSNGGGQSLIGQTTTISDATGVTTFTQTAATGATNVDALQLSGDMDGFTADATITGPDGSKYTDYSIKGVEVDGKTTGSAAMLAVDGKTGLVTWNAYSVVRETSASALLLNQLKDIAGKYGNQVAQIAAQSMLSQYTPLKCCYPDKLGACEPSEFQEGNEQANKMCHVVGSYCSKKFLFTCMVEKQTSCCFQSQLARIMHEQGRPQLQSFSSGWGSAQNPICRGFTPEEFQALNFSIMDLSEWEASLTQNMTEIAPVVSQFINSVGSEAAQGVQNSPAYRQAQ